MIQVEEREDKAKMESGGQRRGGHEGDRMAVERWASKAKGNRWAHEEPQLD